MNSARLSSSSGFVLHSTRKGFEAITDEQIRKFNKTLARIHREGGAGASFPGCDGEPEEEETTLTITIWGDETCHELDRFEPESNADPELPEPIKTQFCAWWETAREPWCCQIEITSKAFEDDVVSTCEHTHNVAGYHIADMVADVESLR